MKKRSFTLIELLVVIALIGLLASIVLVSLKGTTGKAKIAAGLQFSQSIQHGLGADAVGIWSFDDCPAGTANDTSGYGNNGTINGASCTPDTPHKVVGQGSGKYALSFNGNDYVEVPDNSSLNVKSITIEMWAKQSSRKGAWTWLLSKAGWGSYHVISEDIWPTNQVGFTVRVNGVDYRLWTSTPLKIGEWAHLTFVYNGNTGKQQNYFNGKLDASADRTPGDIDTISGVLRMSNTSAPGGGFSGLIDEVRIYNTALSLGEIRKHFAEGLGRYRLTQINK